METKNRLLMYIFIKICDLRNIKNCAEEIVFVFFVCPSADNDA